MKIALILSALLLTGTLAMAEDQAPGNPEQPQREHAGKGMRGNPNGKLIEKIKASDLPEATKTDLTTFLEGKQKEGAAFREKLQTENKAFMDAMKADETKTPEQRKEAMKLRKEETQKTVAAFRDTQRKEIQAKLESVLGDRASEFAPPKEGKGPRGENRKGKGKGKAADEQPAGN